MGHDHLTHSTVSRQDVDDSLWQAGLLADLRKEKGRQRSVLSGLEHHRVTHCDGGGYLPGQHEEGEVPGNDLSRHPVGPVAGHLFFHQLGGPGVIIKMPGNERNVDVPAFPDGLAVVEALEDGEEPGVFLHQSGQGVEVLGPLGSAYALPLGLSQVGGLYGPVDVLPAGLADGCQDLAIGRVAGRKGFPSRRLGRFPVDEETEVALSPGDPVESGLWALGGFAVLHRIQDFLYFHISYPMACR